MWAATVGLGSLSAMSQEDNSLCPWMGNGLLGGNLSFVIDALPAQTDDRSEADDRYEQWDCLRRRLARKVKPASQCVCVAHLMQAYEEATGTRIGCD
jgi:hypothetical protein